MLMCSVKVKLCVIKIKHTWEVCNMQCLVLILLSLSRHLCHGWYGATVCERCWYPCAQCCRAGHSSYQDQGEALGRSWDWWSYREPVQHRPGSSGKDLFCPSGSVCITINTIQQLYTIEQLKSAALLSFSRPYLRWAAQLESVLPPWRPWGETPEQTRTTTPWASLRFFQLCTRRRTWQWKTSSASMRMVRAAAFLPSDPLSLHHALRLYRQSCSGACGSCGGFTKWDQSGSDGGGGDVQRGSSSLPCGCAEGQLSVGRPETSQGEKCWLHVSHFIQLWHFSSM